MQTHYLNISLNPAPAPKDTLPVYIITEADQFQKLNGSKKLEEAVKKAFSDKKTEVWPVWAKEEALVVITPKKDAESLRKAGAELYAALQKSGITAAELFAPEDFDETRNFSLAEGLILSSYQFDKYKKEKNNTAIGIYLSEKILPENRLQELNFLAEAVSLTKTLVNEPANYLDAIKLSEMAEESGKKFGFKTEVLHKDKIKSLKMGGLLAVNKGSETPPTFSVLTYRPENAVNENPLVLVGKGVTFDTGGYSLKPSGYMTTMKSDMAGGAAVIGALSAIAANALPYYVVGLIPATDNKISSEALVVDDVITTMDGTTVEVQNTDAEGRLVLSDALAFAKRYNPELVIDLATLTGASAAITGSFGTSVLGNNQQAIDELKKTGETVYERLVQLPLWEEYQELLKSEIADLKNIGGPVGGVSTAAKFLEHFTDYPWIHLDIAGASFIKEKKGYLQSGATAVGVRLLYEFVKSRC